MQGTPRAGAVRSATRGKAINFYVGPRAAMKLELLRRRWASFGKPMPYGRVLERLLEKVK